MAVAFLATRPSAGLVDTALRTALAGAFVAFVAFLTVERVDDAAAATDFVAFAGALAAALFGAALAFRFAFRVAPGELQFLSEALIFTGVFV